MIIFADIICPFPGPRRTIRRHGVSALSAAIAFTLTVAPAAAHDFGRTSDLYASFVEGGGVVLSDIALLLAMAAAGCLTSIWDREGMPKIWPALAAGILAGFAAPLAFFTLPALASLGTAVLLGLLAAAALRLPLSAARAILFAAGLALTVGTLGGHEAGSVPIGAYLGIFFTLNAGVVVAAALVTLARRHFNERVALIAARALSSWLVAIAVMLLALSFRQAGA
ncbi:MAG: hypothetical protein KDJ64_00730 [Nitratireductor sp.]|nr:hypothetical protein [Nitratireductor sp.]